MHFPLLPRKTVHTGWARRSSDIAAGKDPQEDILLIRTLIEQYSKESRRKLRSEICEAGSGGRPMALARHVCRA